MNTIIGGMFQAMTTNAVINAGLGETEFCVISFKSRGFNSVTRDFINKLSSKEIIGNKEAIICNQENFLLRANAYKINQTLPGYYTMFKPAEKSSLCRGRAKGGLFMALSDAISSQVKDISPSHWRLQTALLRSGARTMMLINAYFPVDSRLNDAGCKELSEVIAEVKQLVDKHKITDILLCGDMNCDFRRDTLHVNTTSDLCQDLALYKSWESFEIDFTHSHDNGNGNVNFGIIDHFF